MKNLIKRVAAVAIVVPELAFSLMGSSALLLVPSLTAHADSVGPIDFESYTPGLINGQDGWTALGASGSGCALYDEGVGPSLSTAGFGSQSFRISDAVTSGCFGDQAFAKPVTDAAGETSATAGTFSVGTRQSHFDAQFDIASTKPDAEQPGLHISVSPDRGDGSRMSYLRFEDSPSGINIFFDDVQGTSNPANFVETEIASGLDRSVPHTVRFSMDFYDGPSNDVVRVYIDGNLKHTGTSWENYYRYDTEASAEQSPRIVKTLLIRAGGGSVPGDVGNGFLFDNISMTSGAIAPTEQSCSSIALTSGSGTQAAGFTETNPLTVPHAFDTSLYSNGVYLPSSPTQTVIPPWVDPATDPNFSTSSAVWVSSATTWPGGAGNLEGDQTHDQWRLFEDDFAVPADAVVTSADLWYTADNAAGVYLNGAFVDRTGGVNDDVFGAVPGDLPFVFSNVFHVALAPTVGNNALNFVVRNWGGNFSPNPTGLLYKATINYCKPTPPPTSAKVTIVKYLDGVPATAENANNTAFPMHAIFPGGEGDYALSATGFNNPNAYQATTADMPIGSDYSTFEIFGNIVGADCNSGAPYALVGYTTGDTLDAAGATVATSTATPAFTNLAGDKFIVVWNKTCAQAPLVKVHILKYLDGAQATAQSANNYQFPMTATWTTANLNGGVQTSGNYVLGDNYGGAPDLYGADTAPMQVPADYTTSEITDNTSQVLPIDASCVAGKYQLLGYTSSASGFDTNPQDITPTAPNFSQISADQYVVVWNKTCPTTATLTVEKDTIGGTGTFTLTGDNGIGSFVITTQPSNGGGTGSQTFTNLAPGTYTVTETSVKGWTQTENTCSITLAGGDNKVCVVTNTKNSKLGAIRGVKYEDRDGDGNLKDGDHHRLAGWTIYLDTNNNGALDSGEPSTVTDSHGVYHFLGLPAGTYHVREVNQAGWTQTYPVSGKYDVTITAGKVVKNKNFGNFHPGSVSGMKYNDANANGKKDAGEVGLQGWTITIKGPHGFTASAVTDANGNYSFTNLGAGTYVLSEVQQTGWHQTAHPGPIKMTSSANLTNKNFGNTQKSSTYGHDKDKDKDKNNGED